MEHFGQKPQCQKNRCIPVGLSVVDILLSTVNSNTHACSKSMEQSFLYYLHFRKVKAKHVLAPTPQNNLIFVLPSFEVCRKDAHSCERLCYFIQQAIYCMEKWAERGPTFCRCFRYSLPTFSIFMHFFSKSLLLWSMIGLLLSVGLVDPNDSSLFY